MLGMGSTFLRGQLSQIISGAEGLAKNLPQNDIRELLMPFPPLPEQRSIVAHISAETAKLDALRTATERTIELLKERRGALIRKVSGQSPAEAAGLRPGDVIVRVGSTEIAGLRDYITAMSLFKSGSSATLLAARGDTRFAYTVPVQAFPVGRFPDLVRDLARAVSRRREA